MRQRWLRIQLNSCWCLTYQQVTGTRFELLCVVQFYDRGKQTPTESDWHRWKLCWQSSHQNRFGCSHSDQPRNQTPRKHLLPAAPFGSHPFILHQEFLLILKHTAFVSQKTALSPSSLQQPRNDKTTPLQKCCIALQVFTAQKQSLRSPYTAQFWRCQYSQGAISSPSNQQQLQLLSMLKLEQQAVGKMHEGHQCDSVQTSWFHRLSIHHHNSQWRHSGPKEQSCPPPYQHSLLLSHPGVTHRHWQLTGLFSTFSRCSYVQRCCPTRENSRFRTNRGSLVAACAGWAQRRRKGSTSLSSCNYFLFFYN